MQPQMAQINTDKGRTLNLCPSVKSVAEWSDNNRSIDLDFSVEGPPPVLRPAGYDAARVDWRAEALAKAAARAEPTADAEVGPPKVQISPDIGLRRRLARFLEDQYSLCTGQVFEDAFGLGSLVPGPWSEAKPR